MPSPPALDVMDRLRCATAELHREIEGRTGMRALVRPGLSEARYGDILAALFAVYAPLEAALRAAPTAASCRALWQAKAALLAADLRSLGRDPPAPDGSCPVALASEPAVLGALYVTEGATLGGALIAPRVEAALERSPGEVTRFFRAYGDSARRRWERFRAEAGLRLRDPARFELALASARSTFAAFAAGAAPA